MTSESDAYVEGLMERSDVVAMTVEGLAKDVRLWRGLALLFMGAYAVMVVLYVGRELWWTLSDGQRSLSHAN